MIRSVVLAALPVLLLCGGASAAEPSVQMAFGNTIVSTYADGRTGELWLRPGGDYTARGRRGDPSSGHWKVKGDQVCLQQSKPLAIPFSYCTNLPKVAMGASWSAKSAMGDAIQVKVVKGHWTGAS